MTDASCSLFIQPFREFSAPQCGADPIRTIVIEPNERPKGRKLIGGGYHNYHIIVLIRFWSAVTSQEHKQRRQKAKSIVLNHSFGHDYHFPPVITTTGRHTTFLVSSMFLTARQWKDVSGIPFDIGNQSIDCYWLTDWTSPDYEGMTWNFRAVKNARRKLPGGFLRIIIFVTTKANEIMNNSGIYNCQK